MGARQPSDSRAPGQDRGSLRGSRAASLNTRRGPCVSVARAENLPPSLPDTRRRGHAAPRCFRGPGGMCPTAARRRLGIDTLPDCHCEGRRRRPEAASPRLEPIARHVRRDRHALPSAGLATARACWCGATAQRLHARAERVPHTSQTAERVPRITVVIARLCQRQGRSNLDASRTRSTGMHDGIATSRLRRDSR